MNPKVLLIYTGGTIGMRTDAATGALVPFDFNTIYEEFPSLRRLGVEIEILPFEPIDSSNVSPALWVRLAEIIESNYQTFDGFVVLHGTDTMSYSSSALSFMLDGLSKPVIFTGSQIPIGVLRTDGRENLITAIEIAAARNSRGEAVVPEVGLYFQNRLYRANRTTKLSAEELDAFRSFNYPALADVGVSIAYHDNFIHHPEPTERLTVNTSIDSNVMIVKIFPGLTEHTFRSMMSIEGVRGIVLETFGSGNAPTVEWFLKIVSDTVKRGVFVTNVTQCASGKVNMDIYETGVRLQQAGVISGGEITTEAAITKMMWLLGQGLDREQFIKESNNSLRGEI